MRMLGIWHRVVYECCAFTMRDTGSYRGTLIYDRGANA